MLANLLEVGLANKRERQGAIRELIAAQPVRNQEELRRLMLQRGWDVTQSTLSRDLREMRVARVPDGEGARYTMTSAIDEGGHPALETVLPPLFDRVDGVGELVVLRTVPGGAQSVAVALDGEDWPDVLGTIAGDDTILIVCRSTAARERLVRRLAGIARA
jgi:transcriptional regulator of arginine metabolism